MRVNGTEFLTPGSYMLILQAIQMGYDTPAKICNVMEASTKVGYIHPRDIAGLIARMWKERYICRTVGKGFCNLELLDKGRVAIGLNPIVSMRFSEGLMR